MVLFNTQIFNDSLFNTQEIELFNREIFNDDIFNTAEPVSASVSGGVSKFKKLKKQKILAQATIRLQGGIVIPVLIKAESKISTILTKKTKGKILTHSSSKVESKILIPCEIPVKSSISTDYSIPVKGKLNTVELTMNKIVKANKIQNILTIMDKMETGNNALQDDDDDITVTPDDPVINAKKSLYD